MGNLEELNKLQGQPRSMVTGGLKIEVRIVDARSNFGRIDVLVTPKSGSGEAWVQLDSLEPRLNH